MNYKKIITQWQEFKLPEVKTRDIYFKLDHDFVTTISGPRRSGKTYVCFQKIKELLHSGIALENILYINFEDEKLLNATASDLDKLLDAFYELSEVDERQNLFLFFDEIQNVTNWDVWIRRISEMFKNIKIVLTGSSSKLLSREISTKLRGRVLNMEVYPLSFKEVLSWQGVDYDLNKISFSKQKTVVKRTFFQYLQQGAYPAIWVNTGLNSEMILQNYFQTMIFKDVVERHNVKEIKKLKTLIQLLFDSITKEISYNKLTNKLKSMGFNMSKNTVIEYLDYLEEAYLFFQNLKYNYSVTKQLGSIKKIYCLDNGLLNSVSFRFSEDIGKLMENLTYLELKRRGMPIFYERRNYECDFLVQEKNKVTTAIQVTKEINDNNQIREIRGLVEALNYYNLQQGLILTEDLEKTEIVEGKHIEYQPLWKWLISV